MEARGKCSEEKDVYQELTEKKIRRLSEPIGRRRVRRPEEVIRDVRGLKLRQRVSLVLGDSLLRDELEDIMRRTSLNGFHENKTDLRAYQDFVLPSLYPGLVPIGGFIVLPINDLRGESTLNYTKWDRKCRCKLASIYRLVDLFGWSEGIYNHISMRASKENNEFLINPFGLLYSEVSAASLIKIDLHGNVLDGGSSSLGINKAGFLLHSAIHEARPDVSCVIHVHTPSVVAVSSMKCGFLRISQESLIVGNVSYHKYCGILINRAEQESIRNDLGQNMVMFLHNHGVVVCGKTAEDAFMLLTQLIAACKIQVEAMSAGQENLHEISSEAFEQVQHAVAGQGNNVKMNSHDEMSLSEYFFEAYMRWLDAQGYRTGHHYQIPDVFVSEKQKPVPECQVPPQVVSDQHDLSTTPFSVYADLFSSPQSPNRSTHSAGKWNTYHNRAKWLNQPPVQGTRYTHDRVVQEHYFDTTSEENEQTSSDRKADLCMTQSSNDSPIKLNNHLRKLKEDTDSKITDVLEQVKDIKLDVDVDCIESSEKLMQSGNSTRVATDILDTVCMENEEAIMNGDAQTTVEMSSCGIGIVISPPSSSSSVIDVCRRKDGGSPPTQKVKKSKSFKQRMGIGKKTPKKKEKENDLNTPNR